jgi:hypothetical protein
VREVDSDERHYFLHRYGIIRTPRKAV